VKKARKPKYHHSVINRAWQEARRSQIADRVKIGGDFPLQDARLPQCKMQSGPRAIV
jgi:hypothetical protein